MQPLKNCIGPTIQIGWEIQCLAYAGFFLCFGISFKVTKVTTGHQKLPKMGQNSIISSFLPEGQKKPQPKAEALRRS